MWWIAAAVLAVVGCSDNALDPSTGLDVHVLRGSPDSVAIDSSTAVPVDSAGVLVFSVTGSPIAQAFTDTLGIARFAFRPGAYRIQLSSCPGAPEVPDPVTTEVVPGTYSLVNFLCDTDPEE